MKKQHYKKLAFINESCHTKHVRKLSQGGPKVCPKSYQDYKNPLALFTISHHGSSKMTGISYVVMYLLHIFNIPVAKVVAKIF